VDLSPASSGRMGIALAALGLLAGLAWSTMDPGRYRDLCLILLAFLPSVWCLEGSVRDRIVRFPLQVDLQGKRCWRSSVVEHSLGKGEVESSSLSVSSISFVSRFVVGLPGGSNSVVESQPSKLLVAGSIPVSRSKEKQGGLEVEVQSSSFVMRESTR
jgi:hypothetical protein